MGVASAEDDLRRRVEELERKINQILEMLGKGSAQPVATQPARAKIRVVEEGPAAPPPSPQVLGAEPGEAPMIVRGGWFDAEIYVSRRPKIFGVIPRLKGFEVRARIRFSDDGKSVVVEGSANVSKPPTSSSARVLAEEAAKALRDIYRALEDKLKPALRNLSGLVNADALFTSLERDVLSTALSKILSDPSIADRVRTAYVRLVGDLSSLLSSLWRSGYVIQLDSGWAALVVPIDGDPRIVVVTSDGRAYSAKLSSLLTARRGVHYRIEFVDSILSRRVPSPSVASQVAKVVDLGKDDIARYLSNLLATQGQQTGSHALEWLSRYVMELNRAIKQRRAQQQGTQTQIRVSQSVA